ncbi:MAG: LuxR C-terminal-related transcriptional regulator [Dysgonamonadaceae bacterium]|jgi:DNA-binding NarL/FixJ family response regulator|nr:LuxR C-terminal-related transcriptional regulator [Dysgonamonadaceae bacterium]
MSQPVRISLFEPSVIIRHGLLSILNRLNAFRIEVFEIPDIDQIKSSLPWQKPDILIVNASIIGISSMNQIRKTIASPDLKCVALQTSLLDSSSLQTFDEVISIYDSAEQIIGKLTHIVVSQEDGNKLETLTSREKEIIVCVIKGMTNKQIADTLHLSPHTIVSHRRNITAKLQIHSTAGLTVYAIVNKLVSV